MLFVGPGNKGELVLANNQAAIAIAQFHSAKFSVSRFHDFVTPGKAAASYAVLSEQDHELLKRIAEKLGDGVRLSIVPVQPSVELESGDGWRVTLTKDERPTRDGISHTGTVSKDDGSNFNVEELETLLDGLRDFFAFIVGQYCSPTVVIGYDANERAIWGQTGDFNMKANRTRNWFNHSGNARYGVILEKLFPDFWSKWLANRDELEKVIDCYVTSNSMQKAGIVRDAVAKSFAGLEILTGVTSGIPVTSRAGDAVDGAVKNFNIDHRTINSSVHPVLDRLCTGLNIPGKEGARLVAEVRNYVEHALDKKNPVIKPGHLKYVDGDLTNYLHVQDLSQFYLEYLVLAFCGAQITIKRDLFV